MDRREKVIRLLNALELIDKIRMEINWYRNPMGTVAGRLGLPNVPDMLEISQEEEKKMIDAFVNAHYEYFKDVSAEELDKAIDFYESEIGKKILNPPHEFLKILANITSRALCQKMTDYHLAIEAKWEREKLPDEKLN